MERETMEFDVVCVGGGVATLSTVLRLLKRVNTGPDADKKKPSILVIDKSPTIGAHNLSGAVVDYKSLSDLLDQKEFAAIPNTTTVKEESFRFLTADGSLRIPWVPAVMRAKGFPILSVSELTKHLASLCEKAGAEIYNGFAAVELLRDNGQITGIRLGDKGIDKNGEKRTNYEMGPDIKASVVVLGEGAYGFLTEQLIADTNSAGCNPQTFAIGVKELIEIPERKGSAGTIMHTFGYPQDLSTYGGGFVYCMSDTLVSVGMVTALDYHNPTLSPHDQFLKFKGHKEVMKFIEGGKVLQYGAKVLPEGGINSVAQLVTDRALIVGDAAGLCNSLRLKGIHLAVQSGISAGDALYDGWIKQDFSKSVLMAYPEALSKTYMWKELEQTKNVRAGFTYGLIPGMTTVGMSVFSFGVLPPGRLSLEHDYEAMKPLCEVKPCQPPAKPAPSEANVKLDRLSDVFFSKTHHEENQPSHLKILDQAKCKVCIQKYGAPCTLFCPAQVYVLTEDKQSIHVDFSNCLHCKTCEIKDPMRNIKWTPPEGGGGPGYSRM